MHLRKEIKEQVVAILKASIPEVENRVYSNQIRKIRDSDLPFINIASNTESGEVFNTAPRSYDKRYSYTVEIFSNHENLEEELDLISAKVEEILMINEDLNEKVVDNLFVSAEYGFDYENKGAVSACKLSFEARYDQEVEYPDPEDEFIMDHSEISVSEESVNVISEIKLPKIESGE